jgi:hypothetical protein
LIKSDAQTPVFVSNTAVSLTTYRQKHQWLNFNTWVSKIHRIEIS